MTQARQHIPLGKYETLSSMTRLRAQLWLIETRAGLQREPVAIGPMHPPSRHQLRELEYVFDMLCRPGREFRLVEEGDQLERRPGEFRGQFLRYRQLPRVWWQVRLFDAGGWTFLGWAELARRDADELAAELQCLNERRFRPGKRYVLLTAPGLPHPFTPA